MTIFFSTRNLSPLTHLTARFHNSAIVNPDPSLTLLNLLQFSITHLSIKLTHQSHARICHLGLDQNPFIVTKLISAYSVCKNPLQSRAVFDSTKLKNLYLWNTLINGYAKNCLYNECFDTFKEMCWNGDSADEFTFSILSKVCGDSGELLAGKLIHGKCVRIGLGSDIVVSNSLMSMYCKCGDVVECRKLFDEMPQRNVSSWNVRIAACSAPGNCNFDKEMWDLVRYMQMEGLKPDAFTVSSLLPMCGSNNGKWDYGRELHCYIVKNYLDLGLGSHVHLVSCLVDMYSKSNKIDSGRRVFDQMRCKNVFAWTAMINGYVQNGASDEALLLFREMQERGGVDPNKVSLVSVLPACTSLAGLVCGKQIHGFAIRKELVHEVSLSNALIDMYSKCGSLSSARRVFDNHCIRKDGISWSSMISGCGLHGQGHEAIDLYNKMLLLGIKPDLITIVGALSACSRSGLVNEGLNIFNTIVKDYEIKPTVEMCACTVNMLGRSGQLEKALDFIKNMPVKPGPSVWGALVSASVLHGNSKMQELAYKFLIEIEPFNPSNYVSISNLYASSRRWDDVAEVRTMMKDKGLRKLPGCSWISLNSETHNFFVADKAHPRSDAIYEMVDELVLAMKVSGYTDDFENLTLS